MLIDMGNRTRNTARIVSLPAALRERRLRAFLSPEQLAEAANISAGTIRAMEGSPRSIHLSTAENVAKALGCVPADISKVVTDQEAAS